MIRRLLIIAIFAACGVLWGSEPEEQRRFFEEYGCPIYEQVKGSRYAPVADIVVAIGALESGYGTAVWVAGSRQVFGITENRHLSPRERPIDRMMRFPDIHAATEYLLATFRRHGYPTDPEGFMAELDANGYHWTENYIERLNGCMERVWRHLKRCNK